MPAGRGTRLTTGPRRAIAWRISGRASRPPACAGMWPRASGRAGLCAVIRRLTRIAVREGTSKTLPMTWWTTITPLPFRSLSNHWPDCPVARWLTPCLPGQPPSAHPPCLLDLRNRQPSRMPVPQGLSPFFPPFLNVTRARVLARARTYRRRTASP